MSKLKGLGLDKPIRIAYDYPVSNKIDFELLEKEFAKLDSLPISQRINILNRIRKVLSRHSPFSKEPVDCIIWEKIQSVVANDYNPNAVAPPEMKLLEHSILEDGYTQPIVSWSVNGHYEVVDGFHRNRVGRESPQVNERIHGYLPLAVINQERTERNDRIASTIRHNRARGKHQVEAMSDIVVELKRRNWSDSRIGKELGMDQDEVLRLCQVSGLTEVFADVDFSQAWDTAIFSEDEIQNIAEEDVLALDNEEPPKIQEGRILHQWQEWECYPAGFYEEKPPKGMTNEEAEFAFRDFLIDMDQFDEALGTVTDEWKNSCEHYLSNERMNRIAWLGQAGACIAKGLPSRFCGGYNLLTPEQKIAADTRALEWLNVWLKDNGRPELKSLEEAGSKTEMNLY